MIQVMTSSTTSDEIMTQNNLTTTSNNEDDDDDDEIADLFSFGTVTTTTTNMGGANESSQNGDNNHSGGGRGGYDDTMGISSLQEEMASLSSDKLSLFNTRKDSYDSHDSFMEMLDAESNNLSLLDDVGYSTTPSKSKNGVTASTANGTHYDEETVELLQWLDASTTANREVDGTTEEIVFDNDGNIATEQKDAGVKEPEPKAVVAPVLPTFETLEEALRSNESTKEQIKTLAAAKFASSAKQEQILFTSMDNERLYRPELYCRMICGGKTLTDIASSSLADSFEQWKYHRRQQQTIVSDSVASTNENDPTMNWIKSQAKVLATTILAPTLERSIEDCETDLIDLLLYHYHSGSGMTKAQPQTTATTTAVLDSPTSASSGASPEKDSSGNEQSLSITTTTTTSSQSESRDVFIPMIAAILLSANIPVTAASVVLAQIIPNFMPLLALQPAERFDAAMLLHTEFYFIACYHIPLLVYHLDRYLPGWQWPRMSIAGRDKENINATATGRNLQQQGQLPPSWLMSHLAGECNATSIEPTTTKNLSPSIILQLWDRILTTNDGSTNNNGNNNATRFFLTLSLLEQVADKLILLTGDELVQELQSVFTIPEKYFPQDLHWVEYTWWASAMALQRHTPQSVLTRIQKSEDVAVQCVLKQRQLRAEAEVQARLDAEAAAHRTAQEIAAQAARDRLSRARLVAFYRQYAPDKESNIDKIMTAYAGRLDVLDQKLKLKYGVGFNPAMDTKKAEHDTTVPKENKKKLGTNLFLSTMNQSLHSTGGGRKITLTTSNDEVEGYTIPKVRDQVSVTVTPDEVLPILCWSKEAAAARGTKLTINAITKYWDNLKFYLVDSRTAEAAAEQGRFPTALELTPDFFMDPEQVRDSEDRLEALRGMVHIVVMGEGYSALPKLYNQKLTPKLEALMKEDESRTNGCALFFCKKGFPFVSVLEDGFAGALAWLHREGAKHQLYPNTVLVDYSPDDSLFGQLEKLHNSSATEKAQRKMQRLLESSLVTMTKTVDKLTFVVDEQQQSNSNNQNQQQQNDNGSKDNSGNAALHGLRISLFNRGNDTANSNDVGDNNQTASSQTTPTDAPAKQTVNNSFFGLGAALNNSMKTAASMAAGTGSDTSGTTSQGSNVNTSANEDKGPGVVPALPNMLKRNPFARFGGNPASNADDANKKSPDNSSGGGVVPSFAGLNQFRKSTMARMQVQRNFSGRNDDGSNNNNDSSTGQSSSIAQIHKV